MNGTKPSTNDSSSSSYDVVILGAGFSGIAMLYRLRKLGLSVRIFESGDDFGGVWHWNRYPGARVDSEWPYYQLNIPEVYQDWNWSEKFPGFEELQRYFAHVDKVLDLRKDVTFQAHVNDVQWDGSKWTVRTQAGHTAKCKYVVLCTGLLHRAYTPGFPGMDSYKGAVYHTADWPRQADFSGKKVAVIGAGATAVQVVQELAKQAQYLTVFMRRPSICLPMKQRRLGDLEQSGWKTYFDALFVEGRKSATGFPGRQAPCGAIDVTAEERERSLDVLWRRGSFNFNMFNYNDIMVNKESNRLIYDFWVKKTAPRLKNIRKRELMVPVDPPYYFGTKRSPLEQDYYEMLDRDNVDVISLAETSIKTFNETGILLDRQMDFDVVVLATGFDSFSGSLFKMGLRSRDGQDIRHVWQDGIKTYLGMTFHGFPNTFMVYSPHAPTALSNGTTMIEAQSDWVASAIDKLENEGVLSCEPTKDAEDEWGSMIADLNKPTLYPFTNSWWNKANLPGQKAQMLTHPGGIEMYEKQCREKLAGWKGFDLVYEKPS
ncbi:hypothetical protein EDD37DRAFT_594245 [Exophiala viscosa]|uniref:uncharacterized protein n=1 Tax=Exophiala viscosa TaxID=2486360 RepID=UPI00218DDCA0|nr:hypothetical protein EDD37DRAFT_594245 [Exophiala viscosa]